MTLTIYYKNIVFIELEFSTQSIIGQVPLFFIARLLAYNTFQA
jgi:hypothetical protein